MEITIEEFILLLSICIIIIVLVKNIEILTRRGRYYFDRRKYNSLEQRVEDLERKVFPTLSHELIPMDDDD